MQPPERPLTAGRVLTWARSLARDPDAVVAHRHPLDQDPVTGGFACVDDRHLYFAMHSGSFGTGTRADVDAALDGSWALARHGARPLEWGALGPWQRAALSAVSRETTVAALPVQDRAGLDTEVDRDHADWLWIQLRRSQRAPMRTYAGNDRLLEPPPQSRRFGARTHACPLCAAPAVHSDRYPRAVCDDCRDRSVDSAGRRVVGFNTSLGGGFEARHLVGDDHSEVCEEVTRSGVVWIDARRCSMGEARFGGVVVQADDEPA